MPRSAPLISARMIVTRVDDALGRTEFGHRDCGQEMVRKLLEPIAFHRGGEIGGLQQALRAGGAGSCVDTAKMPKSAVGQGAL